MHSDMPGSEAIILVKAASGQDSAMHVIHCAGIDPHGQWVRLQPLTLWGNEGHKFRRWNRIRFKWQAPLEGLKPEDRRIDPASIEVIGELSIEERADYLSKLETTSSDHMAGKEASFALVRPKNPHFFIERKTDIEIASEKRAYEQHLQDMPPHSGAPHTPCPYRFKYKYFTEDEGGEHEGSYQDWGTLSAFVNLSKSFGEAQSLARMIQILGKEYPKKGMVFVVEKNENPTQAHPINAIICMDEIYSPAAHSLDLVA